MTINSATGNPFGAVTNSGSLGSGLFEKGPLGGSIVERIMSGDSSLKSIVSSVTPAYDSYGKELTDSDKRLHVIRPRSARGLYSDGERGGFTSDRGPITYMRLLKNEEYDPASQVSSNVDVYSEIDQLLSSNSKQGFTKFFLTGVSVQYSEKSQILTTFGDNEVVYYFGKQPVVFNLTGLIFDSMENDWFSKFITLYNQVLRGTMLAKNFALIELVLPNMKLVGTISSLSHQQDSTRDTDVQFSMQFVAKEVEPLPIEIPTGTGSLTGSLIDFKATRSGVGGWGYSLSSGSLGGGFMNTIGDLTDKLGLGGLADIGKSFGDTVNGFRTAIFSPIFGVISSITKIVKSSTGSISKIISSFTNPVNQILRDITSIATKATSLALLIESAIGNVAGVPGRTILNYKNTIRSLRRTSGFLSRVPEDISQIFKRQFSYGKVKRGAAILSSGKKRKKSKAAVLSSGTPYQPAKSYSI